ncbi:putative mitochondrial hypothetical protein [Leptomonas pyrrhocoris]|uniref:DNL-type domain-containing protein n=1 Tax=Leptomonas pyrrhocoris TaxID=157538 RepID=A0A0M9G075_LEPPY|nr:putative mitochondrial hypothetical protein [Leptomonas pyrrhocoris]XP_015657946.1 putative mitochondrial hypothetical protein [Leptomonas pyrrhocoris]KPA79506.1 putative mitochondrial hypothetical protein [Leptomonas pyrrhocoris]KPA79507.1 putative mitochondrial hypothetical protein [Leptomonas pyrrhocoris]|eukprot:XP_015657945.1 putative mitochondrial hypothetical protein [Leptomonas pyrrhocoris]
MLRQAAKLSLTAPRTALRHCASQVRLAPHTAVSSLARTVPLRTAVRRQLPLSTPFPTTTAASCCTVAPRRWSSSSSGSGSATNADVEDANAPAAKAAAVSPVESPVEESPRANPSLAEQLSALSTEDRERILAALQQPEKEKSSVMGGAGIGPAEGDMVAAFTCGPCDYRMVKRFSKHAYTKGIVIVECPNCLAKHLLADNLGWLEDEAKNIEDILREKGERFTRIGGTPGDFQVVVDDESAAAPAAAAGGGGATPTTASG